ncbi:MAG: HyaD/HybD family hydrogenase maturation endopeptidase [Deltaproteobacteria bacterium]|nr:HyaD/HybD family hydrogenase maturation endopeptidase [Deltaproteobacteria bacterium]MBW2340310.1 HyaD/HybD family hydrogenase maturation endopeptidase [Deltaproteobacteria bacterium]
MPNKEKKIVVLGVGNLLLSDEGVGVHIANRLMEIPLPSEVEVIEGGTDGFSLMDVVMNADRLIVIDAVKSGAHPGSIYRFDIEDCSPYLDFYKTSVHQINILEVISLSKLIGHTPKTTVIGVEPKSLEIGMELSPEIQAKIPKIIELIFSELETFDSCSI